MLAAPSLRIGAPPSLQWLGRFVIGIRLDEHLADMHAQCFGDFFENANRWVFHLALKAADIGAINPSSIGKMLL